MLKCTTMTEANFQTKFNKWMKANADTVFAFTDSAAFELKLCKTKRLPFNAVAVHQIIGLRASSESILMYKIPDSGYDQKPFDCFMLKRSKGFVVIGFYQERKKIRTYIIPVQTWLDYQEYTGMSSITEHECYFLSRINFMV